MATTTKPKYIISLTGEEQITKLNKSLEFILDEKLEKSIKLNSSTEIVEFNFIIKPIIFIFEGDGNFIVSITHNANTIEFEVTNSFCFTPSVTFASGITDITLKETGAVDVIVNIRIFGEA